MSSINQLVSEIAHSVQQPDSVPVRRAIKLGIIHARNELIRQSYVNNKYSDKVLMQSFRLKLIDVPESDIYDGGSLGIKTIKRTENKVNRPTRLDNNLPFHSVRTAGVSNTMPIAFVREAVSRFYKSLPGMECVANYDYINDYIYVYNLSNSINSIIIEGVFEYPHLIEYETYNKESVLASVDDNDEFLLPEDMIGNIKKLVLETFNVEVVRETNEIPNINLVK